MEAITLQGLNTRQRILADMIWACKTRQQINDLIATLPTKKMKQEAEAIVEMMIMAVIEQCYDGINDTMSEANQVLDKIARRL